MSDTVANLRRLLAKAIVVDGCSGGDFILRGDSIVCRFVVAAIGAMPALLDVADAARTVMAERDDSAATMAEQRLLDALARLDARDDEAAP